ncbi:hypothetical protein LTR66_011705 [Elasticomyces elasticus]|nr:hypothetical protein LTR66_011705 [Elasticomyces elasticus]
MADDYETYKLGDFKLKNGGTIPDAHIAYKTFGSKESPAIIYPSWYSGSLQDNYWLIGEDKTLNPKKYFIIVTALFGNGQSSSPSNTAQPKPFPDVLFYDNVLAQYRLVTEHLGIKHAKAVLGWSMGAGQTYQWATQYPDFMDLVVPFCGSARTSLHNKVFLEGVKSALLAAKTVASGGVEHGEATKGEYLYESALGFKDLEDFMVNFWEAWGLSKDPENLLVMLYTWQAGDCSQQEPYNGNFEAAMRAIKAKALVLPGQTDLYFPPEDSAYEVANMSPNIGNMHAFPSIWGHWAGGPGQSTEDVKWLDEKLRSFFG